MVDGGTDDEAGRRRSASSGDADEGTPAKKGDSRTADGEQADPSKPLEFSEPIEFDDSNDTSVVEPDEQTAQKRPAAKPDLELREPVELSEPTVEGEKRTSGPAAMQQETDGDAIARETASDATPPNIESDAHPPASGGESVPPKTGGNVTPPGDDPPLGDESEGSTDRNVEVVDTELLLTAFVEALGDEALDAQVSELRQALAIDRTRELDAHLQRLDRDVQQLTSQLSGQNERDSGSGADPAAIDELQSGLADVRSRLESIEAHLNERATSFEVLEKRVEELSRWQTAVKAAAVRTRED